MLRSAIFSTLACAVGALVVPQHATRRQATAAALSAPAVLWAQRARAAGPNDSTKRKNLSPADIAAAVKADVDERQFLVTGQLSREIYDERCTFTDEIDTYTLDKWIKGTSALFVASLSHVDLVGDVEATETLVRFRFTETLAFNLPIVKPKGNSAGLQTPDLPFVCLL